MRLILLSDKFYATYGQYQEVLEKRSRPYVCLEVTIDDMTFAIPFRHHISHTYAFFTCEGGGLDYTKAVVISDPTMVSTAKPHIDSAEFAALKGKDALVTNGMRKYYKLVKNALKYQSAPRYANILRFSALKYFI